MSLRAKAYSTLGLILFGALGAMTHAGRSTMLAGFERLEDREVRVNVRRAANALFADLAALSTTSADWSNWDDAYSFVRGRAPGFLKANVADQTFRNTRLNLMVFVDASGRIVFGRTFDSRRGQQPLPDDLEHRIRPGATLLRHPSTTSGIDGILALRGGPMLVSSRPMLTSEGRGPIGGTLIMGRYLDQAKARFLGANTRLEVELHEYGAFRELPRFPSGAAERRGAAIVVRRLNEQTAAGYDQLKDIYGKPAVVLEVTLPRDVFEQGRRTVRYFMLFQLLAALGAALAVVVFLERTVLSRISRLSSAVADIGPDGGVSARVLLGGRDELGALGDGVYSMLERLEHVRRELAASEARMRAVADSADDAIITIDSVGDIVSWNPSAEKLFGYPLAEAVGQPLTIIMPGVPAESHKVGLRRMSRGEESRVIGTMVECTARRRSGEEFPVEFTLSRWQTEDSEFFTGIARDTSERKKTQQQVSELTREMGRDVKKHRQELVAAKREIDRLTRLLDEKTPKA